MTIRKHGIELLQDPLLNRSTAFTEAEKQALGIVGLVPDVTESMDAQLNRVNMQLGHKATDLDRYIYLVNLLDHNETAVKTGIDAVESRLNRVITKGNMTASEKEAAVRRIKGTTAYDALKPAEVIIEAAK